VTEWSEGVLMREVLVTEEEQAIKECAFCAGETLDILRKVKLSPAGFFRNDLSIQPFKREEKYLPFALKHLQDPIVQESLKPEVLKELKAIIQQFKQFLPSTKEANLTHADFDPANILVKKKDNQWKITAFLDWEFA
jgi:aminoglycoside phosphotransferase (APT) family kinase protein